MIIQLKLDLTPRQLGEQEPVFDPKCWLDVSAIAAGVGFDQPVFVSMALSNALEEGQSEMGTDYDQRLYDALWYAHFSWSLNERRLVCFTFTFPGRPWKAKYNHETGLRMRMEKRSYGTLLGLLEDF